MNPDPVPPAPVRADTQELVERLVAELNEAMRGSHTLAIIAENGNKFFYLRQGIIEDAITALRDHAWVCEARDVARAWNLKADNEIQRLYSELIRAQSALTAQQGLPEVVAERANLAANLAHADEKIHELQDFIREQTAELTALRSKLAESEKEVERLKLARDEYREYHREAHGILVESHEWNKDLRAQRRVTEQERDAAREALLTAHSMYEHLKVQLDAAVADAKRMREAVADLVEFDQEGMNLGFHWLVNRCEGIGASPLKDKLLALKLALAATPNKGEK